VVNKLDLAVQTADILVGLLNAVFLVCDSFLEGVESLVDETFYFSLKVFSF